MAGGIAGPETGLGVAGPAVWDDVGDGVGDGVGTAEGGPGVTVFEGRTLGVTVPDGGTVGVTGFDGGTGETRIDEGDIVGASVVKTHSRDT